MKQAIDDLDKCKEDCDTLEDAFSRFEFTDPGNIYRLHNPTSKQVRDVRLAVVKRIREHPEKKFVVVYLIAGHGIQINGQQTVVINEFDKSKRFYR